MSMDFVLTSVKHAYIYDSWMWAKCKIIEIHIVMHLV